VPDPTLDTNLRDSLAINESEMELLRKNLTEAQRNSTEWQNFEQSVNNYRSKIEAPPLADQGAFKLAKDAFREVAKTFTDWRATVDSDSGMKKVTDAFRESRTDTWEEHYKGKTAFRKEPIAKKRALPEALPDNQVGRMLGSLLPQLTVEQSASREWRGVLGSARNYRESTRGYTRAQATKDSDQIESAFDHAADAFGELKNRYDAWRQKVFYSDPTKSNETASTSVGVEVDRLGEQVSTF